MFEMLKDKALSARSKFALAGMFDELFCMNIEQVIGQTDAIPEKDLQKFERYKAFRANKQFIQSDALRKELEGLGYVIRDSAEGSSIAKKFF